MLKMLKNDKNAKKKNLLSPILKCAHTCLGALTSAHMSAHASFEHIWALIRVWEHIRVLLCALFCSGPYTFHA